MARRRYQDLLLSGVLVFLPFCLGYYFLFMIKPSIKSPFADTAALILLAPGIFCEMLLALVLTDQGIHGRVLPNVAIDGLSALCYVALLYGVRRMLAFFKNH